MEFEAYECGDQQLCVPDESGIEQDGWDSGTELSDTAGAGADGEMRPDACGGQGGREENAENAACESARAGTAADEAAARLRELGELRREAEMQKLVRTRPALAGRYLPGSVAKSMRSGMSMREAAAAWRSEQLLTENLALKQELANAARTVGSAGSAGKRKSDAFDEQWYDGT